MQLVLICFHYILTYLSCFRFLALEILSYSFIVIIRSPTLSEGQEGSLLFTNVQSFTHIFCKHEKIDH